MCCTAGVLALFLLPVLAKNTYIFENALMPVSVSPMLSNQHVSNGNRLVKDLTGTKLKSLETRIESQRIIAQYMSRPDPGRVDTWQPSRALKWNPVF